MSDEEIENVAVVQEHQEAVGQAVDESQGEQEHFVEDVEKYESKVKVPLSALQKERKKRQELEMELQYERRQKSQPVQQQEDNSQYESATRAELSQSQAESIRIIEERLWIKQNPEKYEKVNEYLPEFLKQRPNLASAINSAHNRYEEAFTLMEALTPKQKQALKNPPAESKKQAPNSPTGVPKAAAINEVVDVMNMSDEEFSKWRAAQRRKRLG